MNGFPFLENFELYLVSEKRYSNHTVIAYLKDVDQFFDFSGISKENELSEISTKLVRGWLVSLIDTSYTNKSVNRKLSSLRTYFNFLKRNKHVTKNPLTGINGPKSEKRLPQFAKEEELEINIADTSEMTFFEWRDALIVELLYQTGIRLSELISLKETDLQNSKIKVLGKRNKERIIPVSNVLVKSLLDFCKSKKQMGFTCEYLLMTNKGQKLYPKFVYRKINNYLGSATDLQKCSPHVLRHTFATHMLNNGAGLESIKELLGHTNLSATQVYTHNSFAKLTNIYSQAHPRGHKKD